MRLFKYILKMAKYTIATISLFILITVSVVVNIAYAGQNKSLIASKSGTYEMVLIKGGCFDMGNTFGGGGSDERPVHKVCVDDFYIGKYEVTVKNFREFIADTAYITDAKKKGECWIYDGKEWVEKKGSYWKKTGYPQKDNHPVTCVSWNDATEFAKWKSRNKKTYRLLSEAEWEYAARERGERLKYSGYNTKKESANYANFCDLNCIFEWREKDKNDGYMYTSPVGRYKPNKLGIYDMTGNVWEWVQDLYGKNYYSVSKEKKTLGPTNGSCTIDRGGSWLDSPLYLRTSYRSCFKADYRSFDIGFRLAASIETDKTKK